MFNLGSINQKPQKTMNIMRKKPMSAFEQDMQKSELKRVLGKWALTSLGIGAIIGTGIFVLTGVAAHEHAGPALTISFIIAGLGCLFAALSYSEFASILPVEGSAYAYSYGTVGELFAWLIGWNLILEYAMGSATVAVGWSAYLNKLLHLWNLHIPQWLCNDPGSVIAQIKEGKMKAENFSFIGSIPIAFNLPAFLIIWIITGVLIRGISESAKTNNIMVAIKLGAVFFVIIAGAAYINTENWTPFIPDRVIDAKGVGHYGWQGIMTAAGIVFFAYIGFDAVSTQAGEAKNPTKDIPFAIIASLFICTVLYILVVLVLTGMVNYKDIDIKAPIASAFGDKGLSYAVYIITIAAVAGLTSVLLVMLLSQTRIFLGMAKDGLLPHRMFGYIHPKFKTPARSTVLIGAIVSVVSAVTPINNLAEMTSIGTLLAFAMISAAVWMLRVKEPNLHRPFKVPALPVVASLGVLFNVAMMVSLKEATWVRLIVWVAIGLLIYFLYSYKNSKLNNIK